MVGGAYMMSFRKWKARITEEQNVRGREYDMKLERWSSQYKQGLGPALMILIIILGSMGEPLKDFKQKYNQVALKLLGLL